MGTLGEIRPSGVSPVLNGPKTPAVASKLDSLISRVSAAVLPAWNRLTTCLSALFTGSLISSIFSYLMAKWKNRSIEIKETLDTKDQYIVEVAKQRFAEPEESAPSSPYASEIPSTVQGHKTYKHFDGLLIESIRRWNYLNLERNEDDYRAPLVERDPLEELQGEPEPDEIYVPNRRWSDEGNYNLDIDQRKALEALSKKHQLEEDRRAQFEEGLQLPEVEPAAGPLAVEPAPQALAQIPVPVPIEVVPGVPDPEEGAVEEVEPEADPAEVELEADPEEEDAPIPVPVNGEIEPGADTGEVEPGADPEKVVTGAPDPEEGAEGVQQPIPGLAQQPVPVV